MSRLRPRVITERALKETRETPFVATPPPADDFGSRLIKYIPAEIVGAYVVVAGLIQGLLTDGKSFLGLTAITWLWISVGVFFLLSPIYMYNASRERNEPPQWFQVWSAPVAFLAWAFALGGPFEFVVTDYNAAGGSIVLVLVSTAIPALDKLIDRLSHS
jgi:hypothetical protein